MRRMSLVAALVGCTFLTPTPARAMPPVVGFAGGFVATLTAGHVGFGLALPGFLAGSGVATSLLGSVVGRAVLGLGLSAIGNALFKPSAPTPSARMVNYSQPIAYMDRVYGRTRKGGPMALSAFKDKARHYGVVLASHSISGVYQHWLDKDVVTIDVSGNVQTAPILNGGTSYGNIRVYDGSDGQEADPTWLSKFTEVTEDHDFKGLAYAALWAKRPPADKFNEIYPNGREWQYAPVIDGNDTIEDPRGPSTGYSNNWALCCAHELKNYWGLDVDDDELAAEATACDVSTSTRVDGTIPRWTMNGVFSDDMELRDIQAQMIAAADGYFWEKTDGSIGFNSGRWQAPSVALTPSDFYAINISEGQAAPGQASEFVARYVEKDREWKEAPSGVYVHDDTARRIRKEPALYLVNEHNQAARVLKRMALIEHAEYRISGTIGLIGYELLAQDCGPRFARYIDADTGKDIYIEIGLIKRRSDGVSFDIEGHSVTPSDWDFDAATEEPVKPEIVAIEDDGTGDQVTGLTGRNYGAGNLDPAIEWTWPEQDDIYEIGFRFRRVASPEEAWQEIVLPALSTSYITTGLIEGQTYEAQIVNRGDGTGAVVGGWNPDPAVQVVATVVPPALTVASSAAEPGRVRFTGSAPTWVRFLGVKIYRGAVGAGFGSATEVSGGTLAVSSGADFDVTAGDDAATNIVSNGGFADATGWTVGTNWSIGSGVASHTAGSAGTLDTAITAGDSETLRITFSLSNVSAGDVRAQVLGDSTIDTNYRDADGTYYKEVTGPTGVTGLRLDAQSAFAGDVDDVAVVVDTVDCLPGGAADFWIVPVSDTGGEGEPDGPHTLQVL